MKHEEILEYPYYGTIHHVIAGKGDEPDAEELIYRGVMDEHMITDEEGHYFQTASYVISIPLVTSSNAIDAENHGKQVVYDDGGDWVIPRKGDKITITCYGQTFTLEIDNAEPSQLGGVSIFAVRKSW